MRTRSALALSGIWTGIVLLLVLTPAHAQSEAPEARETRTFSPTHLDVEEAAGMLREMAVAEEITVDGAAGTITAVALPAAIRQVDTLLKTFDTAQPQSGAAIEIRVFALEHLSPREAVTLLRSKLSARQVAMNAAPPRVALRETPEKVDEAAKLLMQADIAHD